MTEEQKDWYDYGIKKYFYFAMKVLNDPQYRMLAQRAWDARKKAHRWLGKNKCECCKHYEEEWDGSDCPFCNGGENNYWEPK